MKQFLDKTGLTFFFDKLKTFIEESQPDLSNLVTDEELSPVSSMANNSIQKNTLATINGQSIEGGGNITLDVSLLRIVKTLPTENIEEKIYLVRQEEGEGNVFNEYIYNDGWELIGECKAEIDLSGYLKKEDAEKIYMKLSSGGGNSISVNESSGSMTNASNSGQAFNAVRTCQSSITGKTINAASFGVKLDGTTAFSHKTYDTFNATTGAYTGARNTAVLTFSGKTGLRYAKNTGSANDVTDAMYKYVGVIDSPDEEQRVYSSKQVDDIVKPLLDRISALEGALNLNQTN